MLNYIIEFSIRNKLIIGLFIVALIGYGAIETSRLPIDAVPDITNNQIQIITVAPSFGATDIERLVTFPIEQANSNIDGILEIRSFSRFGLSLVTIVFDDNTDIFLARQQVAERLQKLQTEIPASIGTPEMGPISTGLGEIYQYVVKPKKGYENRYNATDLRTIQDWIVRRQLLGVKGVAEVSSFGGKLKQYEVAVDPQLLQSLGVTIDEVFKALEQNNQNTGGAYIERGPTVLFIRSEGLIGSQQDIENIFIKPSQNGTSILMRDVAQINEGFATRFGAMCYNDQGEVAGAVVMMLKGANSSEVIELVKERIELIRKNLPEGVELEPFLDRTKMVNNAMSTVETNLLEGALIVLFVLILFLGNLRAGLIVASVIPLAMLFAIIMMNIFGVAGNLMSLGALDFGLIVDGAVFIVEAVLHKLSHGKELAQTRKITQAQMDSEVSGASKKMARSVVFGQLIILIVYLPTFALSGIEGKMFIPMAQTVSFALLGAFLLSITYVPMMSALVMKKTLTHKDTFSDRMMAFLGSRFKRALERVLHFQKTTIAVTLVLFAVAIYVLGTLGGEFIPALEEGDFAVETRVMAGSSLQTSVEFTQKASRILLERFPEIEKIVTKIGSSEIPTDPMPMEAADLMIILKDKGEWTSAKSFPELAEKMGKAMEEVPGITTGFQFPVQMRFNELMTGARQDVVCKIFGEDLDSLARIAGQLATIIGSVEGANDIYVEPITGMPQVVINYKRAVIAQYQLSVEDINRVVNTAFAGQSAGMVFEGEKKFDLVVRLKKDLRSQFADIENLNIPTTDGRRIPLRTLAEVSIVNGPNQIQREDTRRRIVVGFNVRNRDVQTIVNELQQKVDTGLNFPVGYNVTYGGAFENLKAAKARLSLAVPVALLLIYLLLYFTFNSLKQGLLIYSAIPLSAIGGIFFLAWRDMPFSISAGVGFIALFGVAVLNGIVLVAEFNRLRAEGERDAKKIVIEGTQIRLRPVLMTAFVASLGFLPMALSNGAGAEVQRPLATVVIGGLMIATLLTLFVLPILYIQFEKIGKKPKLPLTTAAAAAFLLISAASHSLHGQSISLQAAMDSAVNNNLMMKRYHLLEEYQKLSGKPNIPQANVTGEFGQVNSYYTDTKIGISQAFQLPVIYTRQNELTLARWNAAIKTSALSHSEIRKSVAELYYHFQSLREKEKLLLRTDSIVSGFLLRASERYKLGESDILEYSSIEAQRSGITIQLMSLKTEIDATRLQFQLMLNTNVLYEPTEDSSYSNISFTSVTMDIAGHPAMQLANAQFEAAVANRQLERARLLPEFSIGYTNQSFQGLGPNNIYYQPTNRFHSANLAIAIPIFQGGQKANIKAAQVEVEIAKNEVETIQRGLMLQLETTRQKLQHNLNVIAQFENIQLPASLKMLEAALNKYNAGEIDYLQWSILSAQSIQIQNDYLDALSQFNNNVIQIRHLTSTL